MPQKILGHDFKQTAKQTASQTLQVALVQITNTLVSNHVLRRAGSLGFPLLRFVKLADCNTPAATRARPICDGERLLAGGWMAIRLSNRLCRLDFFEHPARRTHYVVAAVEVQDFAGDAGGHARKQKGTALARFFMGHVAAKWRYCFVQT